MSGRVWARRLEWKVGQMTTQQERDDAYQRACGWAAAFLLALLLGCACIPLVMP